MATKPAILAAVVAGLLCLGNCLKPGTSRAHPLGNFSISHYTSIRIAPEHVELRYVLDLAEIPTFQELQESGVVPEVGHAGVPAYLDRRAAGLQQGLRLEVNGQPLGLRHTASNILFPPGAGGLPTLKLGFTYRAALAGASDTLSRLTYRDNNFPGRTGWQEIIAVADAGVILEQSSVPAADRSRALTDYPTDLLNSPPQVLEAQMVFRRLPVPLTPPVTTVQADHATTPRPGSESPVASATLPAGVVANQQGTPRNAFTELMATPQLSLGMLCLALVVAAGLGAFHALEPGHGKTVVAAYLVGTRGTARHALYLGLIVTATHTAGVYLLGAATLYASQHVVPERLYPWLGIISGLIIAGLGGFLFVQRYANLRSGNAQGHAHDHVYPHAHVRPHTHAHGYAHAHTHAEEPVQAHEHAHPPVSHHHHTHPPASHHHHHTLPAGGVSCRQLLALGITGGIIPCPAALVVLLSAVTLGRIGFGLLLIVAFSAGLAVVLIAIGLLMIYAQRFMARFQGEGTLMTRWLPLTSAALITVLGVAMIVKVVVSG